MHRANSVRHADGPQAGGNFATGKTNNLFKVSDGGQPCHSSSGQPLATGPAPQRQERGPGLATAPSPAGQVEPISRTGGQAEQGPLKSYFSDGDFSEVLIKVTDQEELAGQPSSPTSDGNEAAARRGQQQAAAGKARRRSSCSDAEDSKRSSMS